MSSKIIKQSSSALTYSIRFKVVLKYLGQLCLVTAFFSILPLVVSALFREHLIALRYFLVIAFLGLMWLISKNIKPVDVLQPNEACCIISFIFILNSLVMSYPIMGQGLNFFDAWFESVSAITTTGLSTIQSVETAASSFLFSRAFMQWYGGLGIIVLSLGLVMQPGSVTRKLSLSTVERKDVASSTKPYARKILLTYIFLTILSVLVIWGFKAPLYKGFLIAISAISTGGFSPYDNSIVNFSLPIQIAVIFISFLGGISFPIFWLMRRKEIKKISGDTQIIAYFILGLVTSAILFSIFYFNNIGVEKAFQNSLLNSFSAQSTAGFSTIEIKNLGNSSKLALIISMIVGGCSSSTAGGIKVIRLLILLKAVHTIFFRMALSKNSIFHPRIGDYRLKSEERESCFAIFFLYVSIIFISWFIFIFSGYDPINSLFEIVSASGTVGMSIGIASPDLANYLKVILCFNMLMGRLEIITFLVIFYPKTTIGRRRLI